MSLQAPHLDDRSFQRIMDEALTRIPASCPAWTDFNASDPGITLLELMAWLTESMLYRMNRVPERDQVAFLRLLGVRPLPPRPARGWVAVEPPAGMLEERSPALEAGTRLELRQGAGEPLPFVTLAHLRPTTAKPIALLLATGQRVVEHSEPLHGRAATGVPLDAAGAAPPYRLWVGDPRIAECPSGGRLILTVATVESIDRGLDLEWEVAGPAGFRPAPPTEDDTDGLARPGEIAFDLPTPPAPATIGRATGTFLRASLGGIRGPAWPELRSLLLRLELPPANGLPPAVLLRASPTLPLQPLDPTLDVTPFGPLPQIGDTFYVASPLLGHDGSLVTLNVALGGPPPLTWLAGLGPSVAFEYPLAAGRWAALDRLEGFTDGTGALTRSGAIAFRRPPDMVPIPLPSDPLACIRIRVTGVPASGQPAWAPLLRSLLISFEGRATAPALCLAERLDEVDDLGARLLAGQPVTPFLPDPDRSPMLYVGLDRQPGGKQLALFLYLLPQAAPPRFLVQHWDGSGWAGSRLLSDGTHGLTRSGVIELLVPADWQPSHLLDRQAWWLRLVLVAGAAPSIVMLRTNIVEVEQRSAPKTREMTATGESELTFAFAEAPVLPEVQVEVEEPGIARAPWTVVKTLAASGPHDRHCVLDPLLGMLVFGNGRQGLVPPRGARVHATFTVTSGALGNVTAGTELRPDGGDTGLRFRLLTAAEGGADPESNQAAIDRGPALLTHRHRAVTLADFEGLARSASSGVALARAFQAPAGVRLVVVPRQADDRPAPSARLTVAVREAVEPYRLVNTRLNVEGPAYVDLRLDVTLVLGAVPGWDRQGILHNVERALRRYLHPLTGGRDGAGWPMGGELFAADLLLLTRGLPDIVGIVRLELRRLEGGTGLSRVAVQPWGYPYLAAITVEEA